MKHTPGPWSVVEFEDDDFTVTSENNGAVADVCQNVEPGLALANANLIAAAPILNEENKRLLHLLNECFGVFDNLGIESKLRDKIVKALDDADDRKTTGEQP